MLDLDTARLTRIRWCQCVMEVHVKQSWLWSSETAFMAFTCFWLLQGQLPNQLPAACQLLIAGGRQCPGSAMPSAAPSAAAAQPQPP